MHAWYGWFALDLVIVSFIVALLTRHLSLVIFGNFIQFGLFIFLLCSCGQMHMAVDIFRPGSCALNELGWMMLFISNAIMILIAFEQRRWNRAHASIRIKSEWQANVPKVAPSIRSAPVSIRRNRNVN